MAEKPVWSCGVREWAVTIEDEKQVLIPLVPEHLRSGKAHEKCFDPVLVSLGPYHYGKKNLNAMDKYKLDAVRRYTNSDNDYANAQLYFDEFRDVAANARNYYDNIRTDIGDEEFTWIMFMDSCFILDFIGRFKPTDEESKEEISNCAKIRMHDFNLVARDLMLLENQLPLELLKKLMCIKARHVALESCTSSSDQGNNTKKQQVTMDTIKNFIAGLLENCKQSGDRGDKIKSSSNAVAKKTVNNQGDVPDHEIHLLHLCRKAFLGEKPKGRPKNYSRDAGRCYFRSVTELKETGIAFEACKKATSPGKINFESYGIFGKLYLPHITVDDMTKYLFSNMIAYELGLCTGPSSSSNSPDVISYVCFMDSLIDHEEDVKILRKKRILLNALGSDQEVAHLFNELATDLSPEHDTYADIKQQITRHYNSKWKYWFANLYHTHFRSPWTFIALISGIFLLVLTAMQTFYSQRQVFYAAHEWKHA